MTQERTVQDSNNDTSGVVELLKWSIIGVGAFATIGGGAYYLIRRAIIKNKQENEYDAVTDTNSKGKSSNIMVGDGQTPASYAQKINAALKATNWMGIFDTDEDLVFDLLSQLKTQFEVAQVSKSYNNLYTIPLQKGLENELDSDELVKALDIITQKPSK